MLKNDILNVFNFQQEFVSKSNISFRFNFTWCMVIQGGIDNI